MRFHRQWRDRGTSGRRWSAVDDRLCPNADLPLAPSYDRASPRPPVTGAVCIRALRSHMRIHLRTARTYDGHFLYCDETNLEERRGDFLIYGGIMIDGAAAHDLSRRIDEIRRMNGIDRAFHLKFNPGPTGMAHNHFIEVKKKSSRRLPRITSGCSHTSSSTTSPTIRTQLAGSASTASATTSIAC